jgi:hypothetical protein
MQKTLRISGEEMYQSESSKRYLFKMCLFLILILSGLSACTAGIGEVSGVSTWTPSATPTPTCAPNIDLTTPIGWDTSSRLIIILFDQNSSNSESLELLDGGAAKDVTDFIVHIIPEISRPGDQISVFQLGYREYENARFLRVYSYATLPQLYDTPSPNQTLTPIPDVVSTLSGLEIIKATNMAKIQQTAHANTAVALDAEDNCKKEIWNKGAMFTATSWAQTEIAEVATISTSAANAATSVAENAIVEETPYADNVVYEGLYHASIDIKSDCAHYDECLLLIIDDLNTWTHGNQGDFDIDLTGIDLVYSIMPQCKDINQPSCKRLQEFWDDEFSMYGVKSTFYSNTIRAEKTLLDTIRR